MLLRGFQHCFFSVRASLWAIVREMSKFDTGTIQNNMKDWTIILNLGVPDCYLRAPSIKEVYWDFCSRGWIKCNIDGSAHSSPGMVGCDGIFRTCHGFTKCCFSKGIGIRFAFEAEMLAFVTAINKAVEFNWSNIWIESDSMSIVNLYNNGTGKIPWILRNKWLEAIRKARRMEVVVLHIFREGNSVADRLASQAASL